MIRLSLACLLVSALVATTASFGPAPTPPQGPDAFAQAVAAYREARYADALAAFRALTAAAAEEAPPELLSNLALAALRERRPAEAEAAAQRLVELDDLQERALGHFLLGQAAFERARVTELAARLPDAEPGIWQNAVEFAERALHHWLCATHGRGEWPEAQRNAERAAQKLDELRAARDQARQDSKKEKTPDQPPPPKPNETEERPPDLEVPPLSPAELQHLRERLAQKEKEKRTLRRIEFRSHQLGERDW